MAVLNALRALGVKATEKRVRAHTATVKGLGTSEHGIRNALERLGCNTEELSLADKDLAFETVHSNALEGVPSLLHVDQDHWVTVIGVIGNRVIVFDSENVPENRAEHGAHVYSARQLFRRWTKDRGTGKLYGISVTLTCPPEP